VALRRIHVGGQALLKLHQRMFIALDAMGALTPAVHAGIFQAFHAQRVDVTDEAAAVALVARLGVDEARFKQTLGSFGVQTKAAQADKLAQACGVEQVPMLVVAGRWRTVLGMGAAPGGSASHGQHTLAVADALIKLARSGKVA
jgi:thiol:disulfide interchange protein DsbA